LTENAARPDPGPPSHGRLAANAPRRPEACAWLAAVPPRPDPGGTDTCRGMSCLSEPDPVVSYSYPDGRVVRLPTLGHRAFSTSDSRTKESTFVESQVVDAHGRGNTTVPARSSRSVNPLIGHQNTACKQLPRWPFQGLVPWWFQPSSLFRGRGPPGERAPPELNTAIRAQLQNRNLKVLNMEKTNTGIPKAASGCQSPGESAHAFDLPPSLCIPCLHAW